MARVKLCPRLLSATICISSTTATSTGPAPHWPSQLCMQHALPLPPGAAPVLQGEPDLEERGGRQRPCCGEEEVVAIVVLSIAHVTMPLSMVHAAYMPPIVGCCSCLLRLTSQDKAPFLW